MKPKTFLTIAATLTACSLSVPSFAWKPFMHASLADMAVEDAKDGFIEIEIFPSTRTKLKNIDFKSRIPSVNGGIGKIGAGVNRPNTGGPVVKRYAVDADLIAAIKDNRAYYRAGTMGPDAYPDIATGQAIIHTDAPFNTEGGTNAWLEHVWRQASNWRGSADERAKVRAFAAGYLTHGAGDMFGHSFVNYYAGGDFNTTSTNFVRHLVLEGYIGQHCPKPASTVTSIAGIENFIYKTLIDARAGTFLSQRLYRGEEVIKSVPYIFSKVRDNISREIDDYERRKDDAKVAVKAPIIAYLVEWRKDIDAGLEAWPKLSHEIARRMVLFDDNNLDDQKKKDELAKLIRDYKNDYLLSMIGLPDAIGVAAGRAAAWQDMVEELLLKVLPDEELEALKDDAMDFLVQKFSGGQYETWEEFVDVVRAPENYFDRVMSAANRPRIDGKIKGESITLAQINEDLAIRPGSDDKFDPNDFAPAYNTLVMSKLILLSPAGVRSLLSDLGVTNPGAIPDNAMLGFIRKFDGSGQWEVNPEKMILEKHGVFARVFKDQEVAPHDDEPPKPVAKTYRVTVKVTKVEAVSNGIDPAGDPDFFAKLSVRTDQKIFDAIDNKKVVNPSNWSHSVVVSGKTASVRIEIWDEDGNLYGDDDHCDASPSADYKSILVNVDLATKTLSRAVSGVAGRSFTLTGNGSDAVRVTFSIDVTEL